MAAGRRIASIDALRGVAMLFMLVDHVRETFYLHMQVGDPVDAASTAPGLFFMRLLSAPAFIALAGLSAWLYQQGHSRRETSIFLLQRGFPDLARTADRQFRVDGGVSAVHALFGDYIFSLTKLAAHGTITPTSRGKPHVTESARKVPPRRHQSDSTHGPIRH